MRVGAACSNSNLFLFYFYFFIDTYNTRWLVGVYGGPIDGEYKSQLFSMSFSRVLHVKQGRLVLFSIIIMQFADCALLQMRLLPSFKSEDVLVFIGISPIPYSAFALNYSAGLHQIITDISYQMIIGLH